MNEPRRIAVIGGGFAGLSACAALIERGIRPILFSKGMGASQLTSGAFDMRPWTEAGSGEASEPLEWARSFLTRMGLLAYEQTRRESQVATTHGVVRRADLVGVRVLDLGPLASKVIGVAGVRRDDWDPEALCTAYGETAWARRTRTRFVVAPLTGLVSEEELRFPLSAFCRLFDDPVRIATLVAALERMKGGTSEMAGLLCGPWLGAGRTGLEGTIAVGETLSPPEGAFGQRAADAFETLRTELGLTYEGHRVTGVVPQADTVKIDVDANGRTDAHFVDAVVIATGGLIGGGVGLRDDERFPKVLAPTLDPIRLRLSGAVSGWDATADRGCWVHPPHVDWEPEEERRVVWAGDVRTRARESTGSTSGGTVLSAIVSGKHAAETLLAT